VTRQPRRVPAGSCRVSDDPHHLERFVAAQRGTFEAACAELRAGRKQTHWMWWIFPQLAVPGRSVRAGQYGIADLAEARAYLAHPVLGPRLGEAVAAALASPERDPRRLMGSPDDMKLRSCLTLFRAAAPDEPLFGEALDAFYGGAADPATLHALAGAADGPTGTDGSQPSRIIGPRRH